MIAATSRIDATPRRLERAVEKANFRNLNHASASIRKTAAGLIKRAPKGVASRPGQPPNTHRRVFYRRAIRYFVDRQQEEALIGFRHSIIGDVAEAHEFGRDRGNQKYPKRPTIGPALEQSASRLGDHWSGSIGS